MPTDNADCGPLRIVLIDDSETDLEILRRSLTRDPIAGIGTPEITTYTDAADALADLPPSGRTVIVCDYSMPGSTGLDWLPDFVRADVGPVIILTGQGDEQVATEAFRNGAADYLVKATVLENPELLARTVREALRRYHLEQRNAELARQLKIANGELQSKNTRLTELTETAHRFVDDVAHEFRTPLTAVREFASIINDGIGGPITDNQRDYIGHILNATRDLARLVDDFLDSSKLKARSLPMDRRPVTVRAIIDRLRPLVHVRAESHDIEIVEDIAADLPPLFVDEDKATRILLNLVINAVKFSSRGSRVEIRGRRDTDDTVRISVIDTGRGMNAEQVTAMFERFRQVRDDGGIKGFGLGLSIVKELVWLNLGAVDVRSTPGEGSEFSVVMPEWRFDSVVRRYLDCIAERHPDATITVMSARPESPFTNGAALRAHLAAICYPMDLVLQDEAEGAEVLLLGLTDEGDRWRTRLLAAPEGPERFHLDPLGAWPIRTGRGAIEGVVTSSHHEVRHCA